MSQTIFLDSTGVYEGYSMEEYGGARRLDISGIHGTDMYCSDGAARQISGILQRFGYSGIHFIDSGNYHYMTKLFTDMIDCPFSLVLFDNHTDMQLPVFEGLLSCGGWALNALTGCEMLRQLVLIGPDSDTMRDVDTDDEAALSKLIRIKRGDIHRAYKGSLSGNSEEKYDTLFRQVDTGYPFYISVDKDVLAHDYAMTNWDQGDMSAGELLDMITWFKDAGTLIGADICGESSDTDSLAAAEDHVQKLNQRMNRAIYNVLC